ncbi:50S ribosomal protein L23 [Candidatus Acetothermia bacterium]|jgi:large subunit ribosomal protein L23|nr:50S ribosomal protein L23 [Candidatus Bipolaricaulota bacterium]RLE37869.1 MAG: 50S ribosomal protein L23 [Candidatus Acetothermia bacterium]RLE41193.1 MAG: 50S ribosomal protein L23 [Candidatus Acetothermia bacterium]HDJ29508.1 50S ribosomal protein L23 [Candidatus Acetothermia bacterium]
MAKLRHAEDVIIAPLLTEETWSKMAENKYAFRVALGANKVQIRKAVEELFKVRVEKVWTANMPGKPRRERMNQLHGRTRRWRKAIVRLAPGDRIDVMGG